MRKWRIVIGLAMVVSMLIGASAASAGPPEGPELGGVSFLVEVDNVDGFPAAPDTFTNCYTFGAEGPDGEWIDPGFRNPFTGEVVPGTWESMSDGPRSQYEANAGFGPVTLEQIGFVTQSLTLHAKTVVTLPDGTEYRFVSNGHAAEC